MVANCQDLKWTTNQAIALIRGANDQSTDAEPNQALALDVEPVGWNINIEYITFRRMLVIISRNMS